IWPQQVCRLSNTTSWPSRSRRVTVARATSGAITSTRQVVISEIRMSSPGATRRRRRRAVGEAGWLSVGEVEGGGGPLEGAVRELRILREVGAPAGDHLLQRGSPRL